MRKFTIVFLFLAIAFLGGYILYDKKSAQEKQRVATIIDNRKGEHGESDPSKPKLEVVFPKTFTEHLGAGESREVPLIISKEGAATIATGYHQGVKFMIAVNTDISGKDCIDSKKIDWDHKCITKQIVKGYEIPMISRWSEDNSDGVKSLMAESQTYKISELLLEEFIKQIDGYELNTSEYSVEQIDIYGKKLADIINRKYQYSPPRLVWEGKDLLIYSSGGGDTPSYVYYDTSSREALLRFISTPTCQKGYVARYLDNPPTTLDILQDLSCVGNLEKINVDEFNFRPNISGWDAGFSGYLRYLTQWVVYSIVFVISILGRLF